MKIIVGLGNIGTSYKNTRHNIGFMAIDYLANYFNLQFTKEKFGGIYTDFIYEGEKVILLKPQKYINLSGDVLKKYVDFFKINIEDILIINDDLDLELGKFKLKNKGRSAGHNGLKNIALNLNTTNYKRLKIGISNNKNIDTKDYVLGILSKEEQKIINDLIVKIPNIFIDYMNMDFEQLMNKYNCK